jgi:hypothetical protein
VALRLHPFPANSAGVVSGWARTGEEVPMWCGLPPHRRPVVGNVVIVHPCARGTWGPDQAATLLSAGESWYDPVG